MTEQAPQGRRESEHLFPNVPFIELNALFPQKPKQFVLKRHRSRERKRVAAGLTRISHQRPAGAEANARRQRCRGPIHRARLPTYCTLSDVNKLLPQATATGPFAPIVVTVVGKASLTRAALELQRH